MLHRKKEHPKEKLRLHPRNKHRTRYDFKSLIGSCPELSQFVKLNKYNDESIDFADAQAVLLLNKALLKHYYNIDNWDIPQDYLTPPIPGRADYIHYMADLLCSKNFGKMPEGPQIKCLDIGVGASCIYPIIGNKEYGWTFIGSDIDPVAIESANKIVESNPTLRGKVELKVQYSPKDFFYGIIRKDEQVDVSICNPPFHASLEKAQSGNLRKLSNLNRKKITNPVRNFGGQNTELWCEGGEKRFVAKMIVESKKFSHSCFWFSALVSKESNLKYIATTLKQVEAIEVKTIPMGQGNKKSRIVAWTFLGQEEQKKWMSTRWGKM
jgi:23S rRNA (adenine1618-N6)-methyltransferase